jgi:phospholipid/cholesterol/gamma-HCH transport system permease protein
MAGSPNTDAARLTIERRKDGTALVFSGRLDVVSAGSIWHEALRSASRARSQALELDLAGVASCDMAGAVLLLQVERAQGAQVTITGAAPAVAALLRLARPTRQEAEPAAPPTPPTLREIVGAASAAVADGIAYLGQTVVALLRLPVHGRMLRVGDLLRHADHGGVRALPLVILLGYLMGLILAFQSAIPMRRYGADLFVANLVTVSLIRELGPLLSAVILAGRTGSAFAAEIGTMKVNQEVDAMVTMGLDPMTVLVLPRLLAVMVVLPALALVLDLAGLAGMITVMRGFGFPLAAILRQAQQSTGVVDLLGGLFKAACFGAVIAAIGCRAGLGTGYGPRAVGLAATAAVVGGIVSTIALDGMLAVLFYRLRL